MQTYINPQLSDWSALASRPTQKSEDLQAVVLEVFNEIQLKKDKALFDFTEKFDQVQLPSLKVLPEEIQEAKSLIS